MPIITVKAHIHADPETLAVLKDAMFCATKVYNGLLWHLRKEYHETGKVDISCKNLNRILKKLPRAKGYYPRKVVIGGCPGGKPTDRCPCSSLGMK